MKTISLKAYETLKSFVEISEKEALSSGKVVDLEDFVQQKINAQKILSNIGREIKIALTLTERKNLKRIAEKKFSGDVDIRQAIAAEYILSNAITMTTLEDIIQKEHQQIKGGEDENAKPTIEDVVKKLPNSQFVITLNEKKSIEENKSVDYENLSRAHVKITLEEYDELARQLKLQNDTDAQIGNLKRKMKENVQAEDTQLIKKWGKLKDRQIEEAKKARTILEKSILIITLSEMKELQKKRQETNPGTNEKNEEALRAEMLLKLNLMIIDDDEKNKGIVTTNRIWKNVSMAPVTARQEAKNVEASITREENKEGEKMVNGN